MHAIDRREQIKQDLVAEGRVSTTELAKKFCVSTETIRKDIAYLEKKGIAKKGYGGAVISSAISELTFTQKSDEHQEAKQNIAAAAMRHVHPKDVVILDAGSTTAALAKLLPSVPELTVVTNSLPAAEILHGRIEHLFVLGGALQLASRATTGAWGLSTLGDLHAEVAFLGTSGFAQLDGLCVENYPECTTKRAMIKAAKRAIVLADSSKEHRDAMMRYAQWNEIERMITDTQLSEEARRRLQTEVILELVE